MGTSRKQSLVLGALLFVLSGAAALAYEVIWFKRFAHVWGSSAHSWASVVAAYLLGLGLGAASAGARADHARRPLRLYALCEAGVALSALLVPLAIGWLYTTTAPLASALSGAPLALGIARFVLTFVVLVVPCALMGATLPLLVRHFALEGVTLGRAAAWLYALNALGAAAGAWIAGFLLVPSIGLVGTNWAAVATSAAVAVLAWTVDARSTRSGRSAADVGPRLVSPTPIPRHAALYAAAALTGAASLSLQMVWARDLALTIGGTTYAFTAVLAVFIFGLGLGSLLYRILFEGRVDPLRVVAGCVAVIALGALIGHALSPELSSVAGALRLRRVDPWFNTALSLGTSFTVEGLATLAMGALFPALCALAGGEHGGESRAVGAIYAWNTVGSIPAAVLTQLAAFPALGLEGTLRLALGAYALALALLAVRGPQRSAAIVPGALVPAALVGLMLVFFPRPADVLSRDTGSYLYGDVMERAAGLARPLFARAGPTCNVLVTAESEDVLPDDPRYALRNRVLYVNGKVDATTTKDMPNQLAIAFFSRFLRPAARDVLVIGMGSGTTSGAALLYPDAQVTCCEIEPAVLEAAQHFSEVNHQPQESPRFSARVEDGRGFVQGTRERFDLILSEPSNPWMVGVGNLFTLEFYETVRERLAPGGMLAQWIQTYAITPSDYVMVVRTLARVFPHVALLRVTPYDTLLCASLSPIVPDRATVDAAQRWVDTQPEVHEDLRRWFNSTDVRTLLLTHFALDGRGIARLLASDGGTEVHTDQNLRLEFDTPLSLFGLPPGTTVDQALVAAVDLAFLRDLVFELGCGEAQLAALRAWMPQFVQNGRTQAAAQTIELALALAPDDPQMLADQILYAPAASAVEAKARIEHLIQISPEEAFRAGKTLAQGGAPAQALPIFEALTQRFPESGSAWAGLAAVYGALARAEDARAALERALALDPFDDLARSLKAVIDQMAQ